VEERVSTINCSVARALGIVGERWTLLIVREAFDGVRRFQDFRGRLGIASNLLATRLDTLVEAGVMQRVPYQEPGGRRRDEYQLTERGLDLRPVLVALLQWGDKYLADPEGPSVIVRHQAGPGDSPCDEPVSMTMRCAAGHTPLHPTALRRTPGPGAHPVRNA
jgi:DNA-binding HxlR family transcriptional regulator